MTNILCKGTIIKPKGKKNKMDFLKRAWAEVDLDSIEYNLKEYRRLIGEKTEIMCVVKATHEYLIAVDINKSLCISP